MKDELLDGIMRDMPEPMIELRFELREGCYVESRASPSTYTDGKSICRSRSIMAASKIVPAATMGNPLAFVTGFARIISGKSSRSTTRLIDLDFLRIRSSSNRLRRVDTKKIGVGEPADSHPLIGLCAPFLKVGASA